MMKLIRDAVLTLAGGVALTVGVCYAWPAPKAPAVKGVPGETKIVQASRVDVVDKDGNVHLSLYVDGGSAKMDVRSGAKVKTLDLPALANRLSGFLGDK
jgi:hypothetical protein